MKKCYVLIFVSILISGSLHAQLQVVNNPNTIQLVNNFILSGVSASNIAFTGAPNAIGSFTNGNSTNIGLSDGIVLTTGDLAVTPIGNISTAFASFNNSLPGDNLLGSLVGSSTYDAAVLEFDLIPVGNVLEFNYVFASEEYPEYVNSGVNDVFGFFVSGSNPSGGNYTDYNIATVPGSSLPVAIDNINAGANSSYFIDNLGALGQTIVFDGFTTVLQAKIKVTAFSSYHLKMAITDVGDGVWDSGIFLEAKSMKSYVVTDLKEESLLSSRIYPNPVSDKLFINRPNNGAKETMLSIYDTAGRLMLIQQLDSDNTIIDVSSLTKGLYFARITNADESKVIRLIKN